MGIAANALAEPKASPESLTVALRGSRMPPRAFATRVRSDG